MYYIILSVATSCLLFWTIHDKEQRERRTSDTSKKIMVFFFLLIVTTSIFYLIGNAISSPSDSVTDMVLNGGMKKEDYITNMVKNIREDVNVGLPPFGTHSISGDE